MRLLLAALVAVGLAAVGHAAPGDDAAAGARAAFEAYDQGWRAYDADKVLGTFASEFEWVNEVGLRFADKATLRRFLERLFRSPEFRAGQSGPLVIRSIRLVGPDVAVISSSEETKGQIDSATGKVVPAVRTNELTVMVRRDDRWLIVDDLTSDESHGI
jgi:uncharacterized protein (TIGR02246 family)